MTHSLLFCLSALIWCIGVTGGTGGGGDVGGTARQELVVISFHSKDAPDSIPIYLNGKDVYYAMNEKISDIKTSLAEIKGLVQNLKRR